MEKIRKMKELDRLQNGEGSRLSPTLLDRVFSASHTPALSEGC